MKRILLVITMVLLLSVPAVAANTIKVLVDNHNITRATGLVIDNTTYVPLRVVSESLGAKVEWTGEQVIVTGVKEPEITGDLTKKNEVKKALQLLKEKTPADYEMVCRYAKEINIFAKTINAGSVYASTSGSGDITIGPEIIAKGTICLAGALVHEASHMADNKYCIIHKQTTENNAYLQEIAVLIKLGAPQQEINQVEATRQYVIK